jgi:hypothetical protein
MIQARMIGALHRSIRRTEGSEREPEFGLVVSAIVQGEEISELNDVLH